MATDQVYPIVCSLERLKYADNQQTSCLLFEKHRRTHYPDFSGINVTDGEIDHSKTDK